MSPGATESAHHGIAWGSPAARWVLAATVTGSGLALLDATTVSVALPSIGRQLGATVGGLQWTVSAYTLTLASLILLAGSLADRFGRRRVFVIGIVWFGAASALSARAPTLETLVAARALQGVGGALLTPGSLAILQASFAEGARAIGAWSGLGAIAAAVGPLVGGVLVMTVGWRTIFWVNLPVASVVVWITLRHVPESRAASGVARRFDVEGAVLATLGLGFVTWALIAVGERGAEPVVWLIGAAGLLALTAFLWVQRRTPEPMMPLALFAARQFSAANAVTFIVYGGMAVLFFLLVVQLQQVLGASPLLAGAALLPITLFMLALSARAGGVAERAGPRRLMAVGPLVMAVGLVLVASIDADASYLVDVLPAVAVFGFGLALMVAPLTATALAAADEGRSGIASGINNAISRTAGLLAVAAIPPLVGLTGDAFADPARLSAGFRDAMLVAAVIVASGGVLAWLTIRDESLGGRPACPASRLARRRHCAVDGAPLEP
ncbi:MFS transporter [Egibacter rhizosphaerae]|uniref:MFS transporter n=1 Tax=Egibacter rhizosphaerae TaxID=1670831 RepID=A0A411YFZ2_9ACTN|nr:MFS transporter [Egibacter rhizosphaerae]QBI20071.1 MFS transporter [Egibacter rhizosphaerae]